jgi:predicted Rossmann fold flavoprotein
MINIEKKYDCLVIGGGAAGLMAAIEAGKRGADVLILEHNRQIGQKILISGGGRCNFTNINASPDNYISSNPHFLKSPFSEYKPADFISLVEKHGIEYYEKTLGQLFCRKSSREIIQMLQKEADKANVEIQTNTKVRNVERENGVFNILTENGRYTSKACIIASGGLSFPKKGATPIGYEIARAFGHNIIDTRPGLVPLTLSEDDMRKLTSLSGISFSAVSTVKLTAKGNRKKSISFREACLITHRGLSGPTILQISSYLGPDYSPFNLKLLQDVNWREYLESQRTSNREAKNILAEMLPQKLADYIAEESGADGPFSQARKSTLESMIELLENMLIVPSGSEGYPKAEVTIGGVDTRELDQRTMESKLIPGLYFIGEVVDVTGWLGGYNFQWAWASGYVCGKAVGEGH